MTLGLSCLKSCLKLFLVEKYSIRIQYKCSAYLDLLFTVLVTVFKSSKNYNLKTHKILTIFFVDYVPSKPVGILKPPSHNSMDEVVNSVAKKDGDGGFWV